MKNFLHSSPVIHLVAPHWFLRDPAADGVKVYANARALSLTVNGADKGTVQNDHYAHPNGTPIRNVFYWPKALGPGKNVVIASDGMGNSDTMTVYLAGGVPGAGRVANLTSSNGAATFIDTPAANQWPFYRDFDGTGDNSFDVLPPAVAGAGWIATRRQSDGARATSLAFDVPAGADLFVMFTRSGPPPSWITAAGFADTGITGQWRDNNLKLVPYALYRKSAPAGTHVALASTPLDYVVLVK